MSHKKIEKKILIFGKKTLQGKYKVRRPKKGNTIVKATIFDLDHIRSYTVENIAGSKIISRS